MQNLAAQIEAQVGSVSSIIRTAAETAVSEAEKSQTVVLALGELRKEVGVLGGGQPVDRGSDAGGRIGRARGAEGRRDHFLRGRGTGRGRR